MVDSPTPPYSAASADEPDRADLSPEIAALLDFEPVPRQVDRPNGWTPARQRRFIVLLAETGSPKRAANAMDKHLSGLKDLYRDDKAGGFRAAWDRALELAATRERRARPPESGGGRGREDADPDADDMSDQAKLEMVEHLATKFLRKVVAEREARLAGEVVAADFYLRQVTALEVCFDLITEGAGLDGWQALGNCRRGGHSLFEIAETPLSRALDQARRDYWASASEPERPEHPPERYCSPFVLSEVEGRTTGYRTEPLQNATGALSIPAAGYSAEQWAAMGYEEQVAARRAQNQQDAADQLAWERQAQEAWEASEHGARRASDS